MRVVRVRVPDAVWREVELLVPVRERRFRYPGRRRLDDRACLEGILTVLRYGLPWAALPGGQGLPSGKTCWRRLDEWERAGVWARLMERLQARLAEAGEIEWERAIVDATFVAAKKGAPRRGRARPTVAGRRASSTSVVTGAASR
jgi:transposase